MRKKKFTLYFFSSVQVFVCRFFLTSSLGYLGCEYQKPWQSSGLIRHAWHATVIIVIFLCIDLPTTCKYVTETLLLLHHISVNKFHSY
jgi:membrane protein DedA with SNARE-associated domain